MSVFDAFTNVHLVYVIAYRGIRKQGVDQCPVWRIELLDEKNKPTDIWSECWLLPNGTWQGSYENKTFPTLMEALQNALKSLLEYSGLDEY